MKNPDTIVIGTYNSTVRKDFSNGYTIFYAECKGYDNFKKNSKILCAGYIPIVVRGMPIKMTGYFEKNMNEKAYYHYTFNAVDIIPYSDHKGITLQYILNSKVKGIGPKTAERILDVTGADIFSYLSEEGSSQKLKNALPDLKEEKIDDFIVKMNETKAEKEIYEFLFKYGGTFSQANALFEVYGTNSIAEIKKNPFRIGRNAEIPFLICDAIARQQNIMPYDKQRLSYMILSALCTLSNNGSTSATLEEIYYVIQRLVASSAYPEIIIPCSVVACALQTSRFVIRSQDENGQNIYTMKEFDNEEQVIARNIVKIVNSTKKYPFNVHEQIALVEDKFGIEYSSKQKEAFEFLLSSGIKILTGGPGTGKTTVINGLIDVYERLHPEQNVMLCAPTGRAAQKMKEATGHEAFTVHRLLNIKPYSFNESFADFEDIEHLDAGLVIIDEMSMVDLRLFAYITSAVANDATVILCGDTFQLPSVGAGNVMADIMSLNLFDTVMLDVVHRQAEDSDIISLAEGIKNGDITSFLKKDKHGERVSKKTGGIIHYGSTEVQLIEAQDAQNISDIIMNTIQTCFLNPKSNFYVENILDFQVLSSTKKHEAGTLALNQKIKALYHNLGNESDSTFAIGDKIMMTENNYDIGYYNGDVGFVTDFNECTKSLVVEIDNEEYTIPSKNIKDVSLAYATTIHKSQGSEYDYVVIALPKEPISILQRNLIYTAVTRAKKYVAIIYEKDALNTAISRNKTIQRRTDLRQKILKVVH